MSARRLGAVAALLLAAGGAAPAVDVTQGERFRSFVAGGWDPLTVPVEWFRPKERVAGVAEPAREAVVGGAAFARAAEYAAAQGSTALLVAQGDRLLFERYWQGTDAGTRFNPQSMAKTVVALLVGVAVAEGAIGSVRDPVERYLPEWKGSPRGRITIEQLLRMASGLEQITGKFGYALVPENPGLRQNFGDDFRGPALELGLAEAPGSRFDYNNNASLLMGVVLERATGRRYAAYLSEKLWKPLGLPDAAVYLDRPGGFPMVSCCLFSRPRDWVAIGRLILDKGASGGRQLVPAAWIEAMTTPSPAYRGYGYQVWLGDQRVGGAPPQEQAPLPHWQHEPYAAPVITLVGHGFQRVWIVPSRDLVIVRAGRSWPPEPWDDAAIPNAVIRALEGG